MATFSTSEVAAITDYLGATYKQLLAIAAGTEGTNVLTGASDVVTYLEGVSLAKAAVLASQALTLKTDAATPYMAVTKFSAILSALRADLGNWDSYALDNSVVYYDYFARLVAAAVAGTLTATTYAFPDLTTLATWTYTGSGTGTPNYTGGPLDMTKVAPQQLELIVTTDIGATGTISLTCVKSDATTEVKTVAVTTADVATTVRAIGTSSNLYKDVSLITSTGGLSGAFTVRNRLPRTAPAV
jgi:hypothetical protein